MNCKKKFFNDACDENSVIKISHHVGIVQLFLKFVKQECPEIENDRIRQSNYISYILRKYFAYLRSFVINSSINKRPHQ